MKPVFPVVLFALLAVLAAGAGDQPQTAGPPQPQAVPPRPATSPILPPPVCREQPAGAWLGCVLDKPEASVVAQIPSLPPGMGLVVRGITPGSPAEAAKLEAMDVLWKFEEQFLVNKSQLAALLNLKRPADEVKFSVFRAGKSVEIPIKLGVPPPGSEERMFAEDGGFFGPRIVIDRGPKTASTTSPRGGISMQREDDGYRITIRDPAGKQTFEKFFEQDSKWEGIPDGWHRTVWVLRRSLDHSAENSLSPVRPPRPRVVPSPSAQLEAREPGRN